MIVGFIGDMGSGKTLSMVRLAYSLHLKGYTIYSNFKLFFPFEYFTLQDILSYAENSQNFTNTVFLIDEAHIFMDSRRSASARNLALSYFILQTRKQNVWLFFTTQ
jgi:thymidine kinase